MKGRRTYQITGVSQGNVYTTECIYATSQKEAIEEFNIFKARKDTSNFLEVESNNIYEDIEDNEVDPDLVD